MSDHSFAAFEAAIADRYAIEYEIGRGSRGVVYRAVDRERQRPVAVKVLHADLASALDSARFLKQLTRAGRARHPDIVPFVYAGEAGWRLYCVMPYVKGESLRARLRRDGRLPLAEALAIARRVAAALGHAHALGILHKDIKPENIFLSGHRVLLMDLGLARAVTRSMDETMTGTGLTLGTPAYMSPEHACGGPEIDGRADLYSLGCVLYEMLAGEPPFNATSRPAVAADAPVPIRTVREGMPNEIDDALARLLARSPASRFPDAVQFVQAVSRL